MSQASEEAFRKIVKDLPSKVARVYDGIKKADAAINVDVTLKNVAFMMKVEKNVISGRFTDLQDEGLIIDSGLRSGRYTIWQTVDPDHVLDLKNQRIEYKFKKDIVNFSSKWGHRLDSLVMLNLSSYL